MVAKEISLRIDTGFISVPIYDSGDGKMLGTIKFNPSDMGIIRRYDSVVNDFENIAIRDEADFDEMISLEKKVEEALDYLLGCRASESIFAICSPFSPVSDGDLYVEKIIEGIAQIIENVTDERIKKKTAKIKRATAKYEKGGMKAAVEAAEQ